MRVRTCVWCGATLIRPEIQIAGPVTFNAIIGIYMYMYIYIHVHTCMYVHVLGRFK